MVVTEILARLGFDVDEKSARDMSKKVANFGKGIAKKGAAAGIGATIFGTELFMQVERAERAIELLAGSGALRKLDSQFQKINANAPLVSEREFKAASVGWFEMGASAETYNKIAAKSANISLELGRSFTDVSGVFRTFIEEGGLSKLRQFGLITARQQERLSKVTSILGGATRDHRTELLKSVLAGDSAIETQKRIEKAINSTSGQYEILKNNIDDAATSLGSSNIVNELLQIANLSFKDPFQAFTDAFNPEVGLSETIRESILLGLNSSTKEVQKWIDDTFSFLPDFMKPERLQAKEGEDSGFREAMKKAFPMPFFPSPSVIGPSHSSISSPPPQIADSMGGSIPPTGMPNFADKNKGQESSELPNFLKVDQGQPNAKSKQVTMGGKFDINVNVVGGGANFGQEDKTSLISQVTNIVQDELGRVARQVQMAD